MDALDFSIRSSAPSRFLLSLSLSFFPPFYLFFSCTAVDFRRRLCLLGEEQRIARTSLPNAPNSASARQMPKRERERERGGRELSGRDAKVKRKARGLGPRAGNDRRIDSTEGWYFISAAIFAAGSRSPDSRRF